MGKDARVQLRVSKELLGEFDAIVGAGNRSRRLVAYMKAVVGNRFGIGNKLKFRNYGSGNISRQGS